MGTRFDVLRYDWDGSKETETVLVSVYCSAGVTDPPEAEIEHLLQVAFARDPGKFTPAYAGGRFYPAFAVSKPIPT